MNQNMYIAIKTEIHNIHVYEESNTDGEYVMCHNIFRIVIMLCKYTEEIHI